jgi:uncharacterized protein YecT (DUF1311 family)
VSRTGGRGVAVAGLVIAVACMAALWAQPLLAEANAEENCEDRKSTADIVECLATQTAVWERRLNAAYQKLINDLPSRRRDRLRTAQRLWLQFRDANCAYFASRAGTIARVDVGQCALRLTAARAIELEEGN